MAIKSLPSIFYKQILMIDLEILLSIFHGEATKGYVNTSFYYKNYIFTESFLVFIISFIFNFSKGGQFQYDLHCFQNEDMCLHV